MCYDAMFMILKLYILLGQYLVHLHLSMTHEIIFWNILTKQATKV